MSTQEAIASNAAYHSSLLSSLEELDYVPSSFSTQQQHLSQLQSQLQVTEQSIKALALKTKAERLEHEDLKDSTARRFLYKVGGQEKRFKKKEEKEEKEFLQALERENKERENAEMLKVMIAEAMEVAKDLSEKMVIYTSFRRQLDELYRKIFDGPTHDFPQDDHLESLLAQASQSHAATLTRLNGESQAFSLLRKAEVLMKACCEQMTKAEQYSMADVLGARAHADFLEREALDMAGIYAAKAGLLIEQARSASPLVQRVGDLSVPELSMVGDIFFDNIYSDMKAHDKIQAAGNKLRGAYRRLLFELGNCHQRTDAAGVEYQRAAAWFEQTRRDLDTFRRRTFETVAEARAGGGPPAYTPPPGPPPAFTDAEPPSMPTPSTWGSRNPFAAAHTSA